MLRLLLALSISVAASTGPVIAQTTPKFVDPSTVAPEFREAAIKRRAEQIRQHECGQRADAEKVLPRDRTQFMTRCMEAAATRSP